MKAFAIVGPAPEDVGCQLAFAALMPRRLVFTQPAFLLSFFVFPPRGGVPAISANGATGGVLWIIDYSGWQNNTPAILDAYDANNIGTLLYSRPASAANYPSVSTGCFPTR